MKQMSKHTLCILSLFVIMALLSACNKSGQAGGGAQGVTTQVSGVKLAVTPQYGDEKYYPQPATSYTTNPQYPKQPAHSNLNGFPITQEKTTMKVAYPYYSYVTDFEDNHLTKYMEELTNVHIEWELLPEVNTMEKINLLFSAGDGLPDVFMGCNFPGTMLITLGSGKLAIPLQDLLEKHAYNMKTLWDEHPDVYTGQISADSNIYGLSGYSVNRANTMAQRFWINKKFLDTLGMKLPTTTDEYYEYLKAVKTKDPNKNGKADEIPLVGATEGWHADIDGFLMQPFIYNDRTESRDPLNRRRVFLKENGDVDVSFNKPEWKEGLTWMRKLYTEGLLAGESFTLKKEDLRGLVEIEGAPIVGSLPNGGPHEFANTGGERRKDFVVLPPLKGPKGVQQAWFDQFAGPTIGRYLVTKDCAIPDIAIKWVDYCFTEDFATRNRYGRLGPDWKIPPEGTVAVDGGPAKFEEILRWGTPQNSYWGTNGIQWNRFASYSRARGPDPFELESVLFDAMKLYEPYIFERTVPRNLPFTLDESRRYIELNTLIIEYVDQSLARFITNDLSLENDWDRYIADLDRMGLAELIKITQTAFDRNWRETLGYK